MRSSSTLWFRLIASISMLITPVFSTQADSLPSGTGCLLSGYSSDGASTVTVSFVRTTQQGSDIVETRTLKAGAVTIAGTERGAIPKYCANMIRASTSSSDAAAILSAK